MYGVFQILFMSGIAFMISVFLIGIYQYLILPRIMFSVYTDLEWSEFVDL